MDAFMGVSVATTTITTNKCITHNNKSNER